MARVLMRVDAGDGIGHGHLFRCLAVARCLQRRGVAVTFATRTTSPALRERLKSVGARLVSLPEHEVSGEPGGSWDKRSQERDAEDMLSLAPAPWDAIVVDHYGLGRTWERLVAHSTERVVAVDDLANRVHSVDVLIDHNWYGEGSQTRYRGLVGTDTLLLLGPRYALLHPEYGAARVERAPVHWPPRRIMVSFGGTDAGRQSYQAALAACETTNCDVDVVVGSMSALVPELEQLADSARVTLHVGLPSLVDLMSKVDFAVGASGTATWERICMGLGAIVATVSESQSGVTRALSSAGFTQWLGTAGSVTIHDYREALARLEEADAPCVPPIVDGHGAARVALAVIPPRKTEFPTRPLLDHDLPSVVTASPASAEDPWMWKDKAREFYQSLASPTGGRLILCEDTPVGVDIVHRTGRTVWLEPFLSDQDEQRRHP